MRFLLVLALYLCSISSLEATTIKVVLEKEQDLAAAVSILDGFAVALPKMPLFDHFGKFSQYIPCGVASKQGPFNPLPNESTSSWILAVTRLSYTALAVQVRTRVAAQIDEARLSTRLRLIVISLLEELKRIDTIPLAFGKNSDWQKEISTIVEIFNSTRRQTLFSLDLLRPELAAVHAQLAAVTILQDPKLIEMQMQEVIDRQIAIQDLKTEDAKLEAKLNEKKIELKKIQEEQTRLGLVIKDSRKVIRDMMQEVIREKANQSVSDVKREVAIRSTGQTEMESVMVRRLTKYLDSVLQSFQLKDLGTGLERSMVLSGFVQSIARHGNTLKGKHYTMAVNLDFNITNTAQSTEFKNFTLTVPFDSSYHLKTVEWEKESSAFIDALKKMIWRSEENIKEQEEIFSRIQEQFKKKVVKEYLDEDRP